MRHSLLVTSNTGMFFPGSEWQSATGLTGADFDQNIVGIFGDGEVKPGIQRVVARTDSPVDGGVAISDGSYVSALGHTNYRESLSLGSYAFVRFGWMARIKATFSGQSVIQVETDSSIKLCGKVMGAKVVEIWPFVTGTDDANTMFVAITDWHPAIGIDKLKVICYTSTT